MSSNNSTEVEVYPIFNTRTNSGYPLRWRTRNPNNGRVKSHPTQDAALAAIPDSVKQSAIKIWNHIRR